MLHIKKIYWQSAVPTPNSHQIAMSNKIVSAAGVGDPIVVLCQSIFCAMRFPCARGRPAYSLTLSLLQRPRLAAAPKKGVAKLSECEPTRFVNYKHIDACSKREVHTRKMPSLLFINLLLPPSLKVHGVQDFTNQREQQRALKCGKSLLNYLVFAK